MRNITLYSVFYLSFLLTLGPVLPKALYGHSIVEIQGDAFLFGGEGNTGC
jgi:hypothetical protein